MCTCTRTRVYAYARSSHTSPVRDTVSTFKVRIRGRRGSARFQRAGAVLPIAAEQEFGDERVPERSVGRLRPLPHGRRPMRRDESRLRRHAVQRRFVHSAMDRRPPECSNVSLVRLRPRPRPAFRARFRHRCDEIRDSRFHLHTQVRSERKSKTYSSALQFVEFPRRHVSYRKTVQQRSFQNAPRTGTRTRNAKCVTHIHILVRKHIQGVFVPPRRVHHRATAVDTRTSR